jgi:prolyl-tRNA synthetase
MTYYPSYARNLFLNLLKYGFIDRVYRGCYVLNAKGLSIITEVRKMLDDRLNDQISKELEHLPAIKAKIKRLRKK